MLDGVSECMSDGVLGGVLGGVLDDVLDDVLDSVSGAHLVLGLCSPDFVTIKTSNL